jgi:hypothetical protein
MKRPRNCHFKGRGRSLSRPGVAVISPHDGYDGEQSVSRGRRPEQLEWPSEGLTPRIIMEDVEWMPWMRDQWR